MSLQRTSPKAEYRRWQTQRANDSISLAEKFPKLKSLTVELAYFDADGLTKKGQLRYKVNLQHAKSIFLFVCQSGECVGGDFDLSAAVADAVTAGQKTKEGELQCQGSRVKSKQPHAVPCHNLLRYKLSLAYV